MEQKDRNPEAAGISKSRLEFLIDGIFAIAMTILVLEIKVPELADRHSVPEMAKALAHHAPTFFSYLLSFAVLGVLWYRHNTYYRHYCRITRSMYILHIVQLAMAAFFPFCAALVGRCGVNPLAFVVYTGCIFVYVWASLGSWFAAKATHSIAPELEASEFKRMNRRNIRGCVAITVIFLASLSNALFR